MPQEKTKPIQLGIAIREVEFDDGNFEEPKRYEYILDKTDKDNSRRKYKGMFPWNRNRSRADYLSHFR